MTKKDIIKVNVKGIAGLAKCERLVDEGYVVVGCIKDTVTLERK